MKLLNSEQAIIPKEKIQDYLLSPVHPVGRFKARFFRALGYAPNSWQKLESDIRNILINEAIAKECTNFGQKYEVTGTLTGPSNKSAVIITAWIILNKDSLPRFITAYPED